MNQPFETVINHQRNKSKTKEAHAFQKQKRFKQQREPISKNQHYDIFTKTISADLKKRNKSFSYAQRFVYKHDETPSPLRYIIKGTFQNLQKKQGPRIINDKKSQQRPISPGPAAYNPKIFNSTLKFSFGSQTKINNKIELTGPGYYKTQKYGSINQGDIDGRFHKSQICIIPQSKRFADKDQRKEFPSPQNYTIKIKKQNSYTFGHQKRDPIVNKSNIAPGPGAYPTFSQFASRKSQLQNKLNKLTSLIKQDRKNQ